MDQNQHGQNHATKRGTSTTQAETHAINQYQSNHMMPPPNPYPPTQVFPGPFAAPSPYLRSDQQHGQHQYMHLLQQQQQQQQQQELQQKLNSFWESHYQEIEQTTDFKNQSLPLARIKKIMKSDEDVKMISAEAPVVFAKACEMFIMELTMRAWANAEENKRRTLQKNDIAAAVTKTEEFDFLVDVVPRDETVDIDYYSGIRRSRGNGAYNNNIGVGPYENKVPYYYYMPPQHDVGPPYMPHQQHVVGPTHPYVAQVGPRQPENSADSED